MTWLGWGAERPWAPYWSHHRLQAAGSRQHNHLMPAIGCSDGEPCERMARVASLQCRRVDDLDAALGEVSKYSEYSGAVQLSRQAAAIIASQNERL